MEVLQQAATAPPASSNSRTEVQQPRGPARHPLHDAAVVAHPCIKEMGLCMATSLILGFMG